MCQTLNDKTFSIHAGHLSVCVDDSLVISLLNWTANSVVKGCMVRWLASGWSCLKTLVYRQMGDECMGSQVPWWWVFCWRKAGLCWKMGISFQPMIDTRYINQAELNLCWKHQPGHPMVQSNVIFANSVCVCIHTIRYQFKTKMLK